MTPQELKNSILQLAIQGKLVEQRPEEGTAEELLVKSRKKPAPNDESYDIPETWCWALLPDVADILYGFPFNSEKFNEAQIGMPIIRIRDIISGQSKTFSDEECDERYRIKRGDMLVGMDGNFQVAFWNSEDAWLNQRVCKITADSFLLNQNYLFFYLPIILAEINGSVSYSTVKHLSAKILNAMRIPLPPLAEQKRIVAKIEELLPLIDRYDQAWTRLEDFNKRFPGDMQKSILQMAIQGKLVEQRPEEGTGEELYRRIQAEKQALIKAGKIKKEKPLPEITEDEIPFEIPESWKWVRLSSLASAIVDCPHSTPHYYEQSSDYVAIDTNCIDADGNITGWRYVDKETYQERISRLQPMHNDIVYTREGSICRAAILPANKAVCLGQRVMLVRCPDGVLTEYLKMILMTPQTVNTLTAKQKGIGAKHVNVADVCNLILPLPPTAEQVRIIFKLNLLMPLCRRLK